MTPNENTQAERKAFEALSEFAADPALLERDSKGRYFYTRVRVLWEGWQARAALSAPPAAECDHEWVSARNKYITSGEICAKLCGAIRTEGSATPVAAVAQPVEDFPHKVKVWSSEIERLIGVADKHAPGQGALDTALNMLDYMKRQAGALAASPSCEQKGGA